MKIIIEQPRDGEEDTIIIRCRHASPELMQLLGRMKKQGMIIGYVNDTVYKLNPMDILYIETVERKTFLYCDGSLYESKQKLYELEENLKSWNFLRVGKSLIVNMEKIISVTPLLSRRLEAVLSNNERIIISRQYVSVLNEYLGI